MKNYEEISEIISKLLSHRIVYLYAEQHPKQTVEIINGNPVFHFSQEWDDLYKTEQLFQDYVKNHSFSNLFSLLNINSFRLIDLTDGQIIKSLYKESDILYYPAIGEQAQRCILLHSTPAPKNKTIMMYNGMRKLPSVNFGINRITILFPGEQFVFYKEDNLFVSEKDI